MNVSGTLAGLVLLEFVTRGMNVICCYMTNRLIFHETRMVRIPAESPGIGGHELNPGLFARMGSEQI
jgi:hypothetical protein